MLTPQISSPRCQESQAILQLRNGSMLFVPDEGTSVIEGAAAPDGRLLGIRGAIGADKKPYDTRFDGTWTQTRATGIYRTPRCSFLFEGALG